MFIGMRKEDVDVKRIVAATFHPTKDEWYVIVSTDSGKVSATFTDGVCTCIEPFSEGVGSLMAWMNSHCGKVEEAT